MWDVVERVRGDGGAVCFATQNVEEVEHADRVLALQDGRVVLAPSRRFRMSARLLLLRKDLLVLRRSPLLLGALLAYPIVIALLVGLVAGYANAKPRVAFVDEDGMPPVVAVGGHRFDIQTVIDQVAQQVTLVRMSARERRASSRPARSSPRSRCRTGFLAQLGSDGAQPELVLRTGERRPGAARRRSRCSRSSTS